MADVKKRILIASVLKPVNDTRMTGKIAQSLADTKQFDIHVTGFPAAQKNTPGFTVHPLPFFKRLSLQRLFIPWKIFRKAILIKPHLLIITTHELLLIAMFTRVATGCKVIYDLQENYFRNILFTKAFPFFIRPVIAFYVRMKELLCAPFVSHFFLAEKAYAKELSFSAARSTVLENKLKRPNISPSSRPDKNQLLFSGTLAESTGVFKAIEIAEKLHRADQNISLTIIGYCAQQALLERIKKVIAPHSFIRLIGGNILVPHEQILEQIQVSGAGIIAYPYNPSTVHSVPTKLFEYLGFKLPIILIHHTPWVERCQSFHAAVVFDPDNLKPEAILRALKTQQFYDTAPNDVFWESEEPKLTKLISSLLA